MLLRRVTIGNVRSFLGEQTLELDKNISILIGPNGGGKTNLLDAVSFALRKCLFSEFYFNEVEVGKASAYDLEHNDALSQMRLEKHSRSGADLSQKVEVEIEVTTRDIENMRKTKEQTGSLLAKAAFRFRKIDRLNVVSGWDVDAIKAGRRFTYSPFLPSAGGPEADHFQEYLRLFEINSVLRAEYDEEELSWPLLYLPVSRSAQAGQTTRVDLPSFRYHQVSKTLQASMSNITGVPLFEAAIGRMAEEYRELLEEHGALTNCTFKKTKKYIEMTAILRSLNYDWKLVCTNRRKNIYELELSKEGSSYFIESASSGERALLGYIFAIYALNVRDALIVIDEPELHLHPKWQRSLLAVFEQLTAQTGNQFLLATHSPVFISPRSVGYVSRVFTDKQESKIQKLDTGISLPLTQKQLMHIVTSQNNESIFFADHVILVEGLSDRIFLEKVLDSLGRSNIGKVIEVVSVGGKAQFDSYSSLLGAFAVPCSIIADLDYLRNIGPDEIKALYKHDPAKFKESVLVPGSRDGASLVAVIEEALRTGDFEPARETFEYIKRRVLSLGPDISDDDRVKMDRFILSLRESGVYVLRKGSLEDYLPSTCRGKDIDKLILFLTEPNCLDYLPGDSRSEIEKLCKHILDRVSMMVMSSEAA